MGQVRNYYENSQNKESIQFIYHTGNNLSAKYEVMGKYGISKELFETWIIEKLNLLGSERVLDIGTGNGRFSIPTSKILKSNGGFVVCCDLAEGVMNSARIQAEQEGLPILHMIADAENLPFLSDEFDVVMANHMLYHLPDLKKGLKEISRVLRNTGKFLATTNSSRGMPEFFTLHQETMRQLHIPFEIKEDPIPFSLENGEAILSKHFNRVELMTYEAGFKVTEPEPVLQYYMATQLYQGPFNDNALSREHREAIAQTFLALTRQKIESCDGELIISKPVAAFICELN
ncbi:ubiquinone/menaquinone biosynthesis C-methylase UbiE [Paenibacillus rhizosphaerae]|uniref:Ubiquinone/menaquinone biosynthesis C-methylase UbiE n=1 Tax=Paenibacillus rhizosphaerae TaxID=297318 RepID=A0A839TVY5_9BACL|nr:class I SAM-dependent methyltransferase [Paenibacillus rhizosphaerae]MBB3128847.1 ubiquinone/menaquinone biosynthesis C-methylase UbiE [Paenibacillus rhizosphaerae]